MIVRERKFFALRPFSSIEKEASGYARSCSSDERLQPFLEWGLVYDDIDDQVQDQNGRSLGETELEFLNAS